MNEDPSMVLHALDPTVVVQLDKLFGIVLFRGFKTTLGDTLVDVPDTLLQVEADGSFHLEYTVSAVQKPKHHESLAFSNSVVVEDRSCCFQNGSRGI